MAIDEEDGLWVALWDGGAVRHYDRDGVLRDTIRVPASRVTACAFGDEDRRTLYITTSRLGIADGDEPLAGSVFAWRAPVRGAIPHAWAG
jgi:sugar lactone lactonase YvrE